MRIQLDVSVARLKQIKDLIRIADFKNYPDMLNNAVSLMGWAIRHVQEGRVIVAFDERRNAMKELSMPFLEHIARSRESEKPNDEEYADPEELLDEAHKREIELAAALAAVTQRAEDAEARLARATARTSVAGGPMGS